MFKLFNKKKEIRSSVSDPFYRIGINYFSHEIDNIVLSAISYYTNPIKELPLNILDGSGQKLLNHRLNSVLASPSNFHNKSIFWSRAMHNLLLNGEAHCLIQGDNPDNLFLYWNKGDCYSFETGKQNSPEARRYYRSNEKTFSPEDILHFRGELGATERGASKLSSMDEVINNLKQVTSNVLKYGFASKGILTGIGDSSNKEEVKAFQKTLKSYFGDNESGYRVLSLDTGQELKTFTPDLKTEHFINLKKLLTREIYSLFGISQALASDNASSVSYKALTEALNTFSKVHLSPTLAIIESELSEKLLNTSEKLLGYKINFDLDALHRGDSETIYKNLSLASGQQAFLTPNEIRYKLSLPSVPSGDELFKGEVKGKQDDA